MSDKTKTPTVGCVVLVLRDLLRSTLFNPTLFNVSPSLDSCD